MGHLLDSILIGQCHQCRNHLPGDHLFLPTRSLREEHQQNNGCLEQTVRIIS